MTSSQNGGKGTYEKRKVLADGSVKVYRYGRSQGGGRDGPDPAAAADKTWAALVFAYRLSPGFRREIKANTRRHYERQLARVSKWGPRQVAGITRAETLAIRDALALDTPAEANAFIGVISVLMAFAVDRGFRDWNPVAKIKKLKGGSWEPWAEEQLTFALGHLAERWRRAVIVAVYTGQREGDCVKMTWSDFDGSGVRVVQEKTGVKMWIPAHAEFARELAVWKADATAPTLLTTSRGKPWSDPQSFGSSMSQALRHFPELDGAVFHGLRKLALTRLADAGCTPHEIQAISGHATLQMIEHYTRRANQRRLAQSAMDKLRVVK